MDDGNVGDLRILPFSVRISFQPQSTLPPNIKHVQGVSFIAASNMAALSSREPASAGTSRNISGAQGSENHILGIFTLFKTNSCTYF
jgi:hypothetical protein